MGFSIKLAPGVRVRASSQGLRASVGPRVARVHFGAGRTGVSTGAGPVSLYGSLSGGSRRGSSRGGRAPSAASYQRELVRQQRQANREAKIEDAKALATAFSHILELHHADFPLATRPTAPAPAQPDRNQIYAHYERQALQGLGLFKRAERAAARERAAAWTSAEADRQWNAQVEGHNQTQSHLDHMWHQLCSNSPEIVHETIGEAFEDNEVPSAVLSVDGAEVSLALLVPAIDDAVPDRWPSITDAGNVSIRKLGKRERSDYYTLFVCAQTLVTVREAFAVAPGLRSARVTALRIDGQSVYGQPRVSCLLAAAFDRDSLNGVLWQSASSAEIVSETSRELLLRQSGPSKDLTPLELSREPDLDALVQSIDLHELGAQIVPAATHVPPAEPRSRHGMHTQESPSVATSAPNPATLALDRIAGCRGQVNQLLTAYRETGTDVTAQIQETVQGSIDNAVNTLTQISERVFTEIRAGGVRESRGQSALPHVKQAIAATTAITENAQGRDPHSLLADAEAILHPLEIAHNRISA